MKKFTSDKAYLKLWILIAFNSPRELLSGCTDLMNSSNIPYSGVKRIE
jgi:hypothetical protein